MKANISSIRCIRQQYEFSKGSIVQWQSDDNSGKAHGLFAVDIVLKGYGDIRVIRMHAHGPASEHASLHLLKIEIKEKLKSK